MFVEMQISKIASEFPIVEPAFLKIKVNRLWMTAKSKFAYFMRGFRQAVKQRKGLLLEPEWRVHVCYLRKTGEILLLGLQQTLSELNKTREIWVITKFGIHDI